MKEEELGYQYFNFQASLNNTTSISENFSTNLKQRLAFFAHWLHLVTPIVLSADSRVGD